MKLNKIKDIPIDVVVSDEVKPGELFLVSGAKPKPMMIKEGDPPPIEIREVLREDGGVKIVIVSRFPECDFLDCLKLINFK